ncbi:MAG: ECF-type sigma factor [Phycisphaerae bacterium]
MQQPETEHAITRLLQAQPGPGGVASPELLQLVYDQLRKLAQQRMRGEHPGHTLQATALVHEAYLRVAGDNSAQWQGRRHFFAAAAEAMRRILIEHARRKAGPKQGGHLNQLEIDEAIVAGSEKSEELLALDEALSELEGHDEFSARLVKLRFFAGLKHHEAADVLGIGRREADRIWALARAWLYRRVSH